MKKELQNKLFEKYPKIFRQKDLPAQQTAMCWGISCGDGWFDLIDELCGEIQNRVENINRIIKNDFKVQPKTIVPVKREYLVCEATQVKEKYGGLRFYVYGGDEYIEGLISMAESLSYRICTKCGNKSKPQKDRGWIYTLCNTCKDKNE